MRSAHIDSSEVTIEVREGKVSVEGTVPERRMKHMIEDIADQCPGVKDVENKIRVQQQSQQHPSEGGSWAGSSQGASQGSAEHQGTTSGSTGKSGS